MKSKPKTKPKKTPRKQSSSRMSSLASRLLNRLGDMPGQYMIRNQEEGTMVRAWEIRSLCASVLSQDEAKGQRPAKAKWKGKR